MKPALFIITGSNGAGKSSVGATYLPAKIQQHYTVFDLDKLVLNKRRELHQTIKSDKEAKKLANEWVDNYFLTQIKIALANKDHFAYEGHFRDQTTFKLPRKFKRNGYEITLIFMGLTDPHESELRVIERAKHGGHNVPEYEIRLNFYGNLVMLNKNYKLFDDLIVIDTSKNSQHKILLHFRDGNILFYSAYKDLPFWFTEFLPNLAKLIKAEEKNR